MPGPEAAVAAGASLLTNIAGMIVSAKQNKRNMKDLNQLGVKAIDPYAQQQLALAQNLYQGRMAGATQEEQNIETGQANATAATERNATDSSQVLATIAGLQGGSNDAFAQLAAKESADKMNRAGTVMSAQNTMINEGDKVWADRLRQLQQRLGIRSVATQNTFNALQGIGGSLSMAGSAFGGGGGAGSASAMALAGL